MSSDDPASAIVQTAPIGAAMFEYERLTILKQEFMAFPAELIRLTPMHRSLDSKSRKTASISMGFGVIRSLDA